MHAGSMVFSFLLFSNPFFPLFPCLFLRRFQWNLAPCDLFLKHHEDGSPIDTRIERLRSLFLCRIAGRMMTSLFLMMVEERTSGRELFFFSLSQPRPLSFPPPLLLPFQKKTAAVGATPQSSDLFDRVTAAIEATATHDFSAIRGRVKRDFEYFSLAGTGKALPSRLDKSAPSEKALDEREQRFLSDFHSLLKTAHFKVLSAGEWETAQAENFTVSFFPLLLIFLSSSSSTTPFSLKPLLFLLFPPLLQFNSPVEVNWDALDTKLLSAFWAAGRARERAVAAPVSDRILIYHRGVKTVKASGRFIDDKVDLLVEYLLIGPATRAAGAVAKAVAKVRGGGNPSGDGNGNVDVATRLQQLASGVSSAPSADAEAAAAAAEAAGTSTEGAARAALKAKEAAEAEAAAEKLALSHDAAQRVRRVTFRHLMPSVLSVLGSFPLVLTIEEPAYKDVVVLYRKSVPDKQVRKSEKDPEFDYDPRRARRNVHVKRFADVPMADAEMIFPDKTIWLKPILLLQLIATIVGGFVAAWAALGSAGKVDKDEDPSAKAKRSLSVAVAALSLVGGRAAQVYSQAQAARQAVQDAITRRLYDTTMDSQESDVLFLLDEMADQHVKVRKIDFKSFFVSRSRVFSTKKTHFFFFSSSKQTNKKNFLPRAGALPRLLHAPGQEQGPLQRRARRRD